MTKIFFLILVCYPIFALAEEEEILPTTKEFKQIEKLDKEDNSVLQRHLPFYFVYGEPLSKLQFSFKSPAVRKFPLYFAYTQVMFWALKEDSKPFRDLTYNPEVFYRWSNKNWQHIESLDFGFWGHHSNGKKDADSRSYDKQYLRLNLAQEGHRWVTRFSTEIAYMNNFDSTNADIQDYVGPLSFYLSFIQLFDAYVDKSEVVFKASPGGKYANRWDRGGYEISWAFRLGKIELVPAFYFQYYHGYAETLLNYSENVNEFRAGLLF